MPFLLRRSAPDEITWQLLLPAPRARLKPKKSECDDGQSRQHRQVGLGDDGTEVTSLIVVIISADLPAGDYVDVFEAGSDADKEKNIKEPGLRTKPTVKCQAEPDADRDGQRRGYPHA